MKIVEEKSSYYHYDNDIVSMSQFWLKTAENWLNFGLKNLKELELAHFEDIKLVIVPWHEKVRR